jgi:hypothetical protein
MIVTCKNEDGSQSLQFYKYKFETGTFVREEFTKSPITYESEFFIKNLVANDLNNDGDLDLILTVYDSFKAITFTEVYIYDSKSYNFASILKLPTGGVFIGDFDGDRQ